MPIEADPSDRIKVISLGELRPPGVCVTCGNGTHPDGYVTFDNDIEMWGEVYVCMTCLGQAAQVIGLMSKEESDYAHKLNEEMASQLKVATEQLEAAHERLSHYDSLLNGAFAGSGISVGDINLGASSDEEAGNESHDNTNESVSVGEKNESVVTESGSSDRSGNISGTTASNRSINL